MGGRHLHRHDFHGDWNYTVTADLRRAGRIIARHHGSRRSFLS